MKMSTEQIEILGKLKIDTLRIVKEEAESFLQNQIESENIIVGKSTNLFLLFITILISIIGYFATQEKENIQLLEYSFLFGIPLFISILFLSYVIFPMKVYLKGTPPDKLLFEDIFLFDENDELRLLKNRIYCINNDILKNKKIQSKRVYYYRLSITSILIGLSLVCFKFFL